MLSLEKISLDIHNGNILNENFYAYHIGNEGYDKIQSGEELRKKKINYYHREDWFGDGVYLSLNPTDSMIAHSSYGSTQYKCIVNGSLKQDFINPNKSLIYNFPNINKNISYSELLQLPIIGKECKTGLRYIIKNYKSLYKFFNTIKKLFEYNINYSFNDNSYSETKYSLEKKLPRKTSLQIIRNGLIYFNRIFHNSMCSELDVNYKQFNFREKFEKNSRNNKLLHNITRLSPDYIKEIFKTDELDKASVLEIISLYLEYATAFLKRFKKIIINETPIVKLIHPKTRLSNRNEHLTRSSNNYGFYLSFELRKLLHDKYGKKGWYIPARDEYIDQQDMVSRESSLDVIVVWFSDDIKIVSLRNTEYLGKNTPYENVPLKQIRNSYVKTNLFGKSKDKK